MKLVILAGGLGTRLAEETGVVIRKGKYLSPQARAFVDQIKPAAFARGGYDEAGHSER